LAIYRANGIRSSEANILRLLGRAHLSNNQPQRAESRLIEAIQILNDILIDVSGDADKILLFETQLFTFSLLQQALADQGYFERSLVVAEQGITRALVTLLSQRNSNAAAELSGSPTIDMEAIEQTAQQTNSTLVAYSIILDVDANYELNRRFGGYPESGYSFNYSIYIWVVSPDGSVARFPNRRGPMGWSESGSMDELSFGPKDSSATGLGIPQKLGDAPPSSASSAY
jgi:hypothetical protein